MAQPTRFPRIFEVMDPGANQHVVMVLMPTGVGTGYPDKPWGTPITDIGVSAREVARFEDYTLVDFEPVKDSDDLFWIFQKLPGPVLDGAQAYAQRTHALTTEQMVAPGTAAETGLLVVESSVVSNGKGRSVRQTVKVTAWPEHKEVEWKEEIGGHVVRTEQFVPPSDADTPDARTSYRIINEDRSLRITEEVPTDVLADYVLEYPTRINLDLPRVLKSVTVVWNESSDTGVNDNDFEFLETGDTYSFTAQNSDSGNSSMGLNPDVRIEWEDYSSNNLFATAYVFYLPMPVTEAALLARVTALAGAAVIKWPVFKTRAHTISMMGQSGSVAVQTSASIQRNVVDGVVTAYRNQKGSGDDVRINSSNSSIQIPPSIHGDLDLTGITSRSESVSSTATSPVYIGDSTSITPLITRVLAVVGQVTPTSLPATSPAAVPVTGLYLVDAKVQPYEYGHARVYAEVFDATNLA